eukprot:5634062-Pyramimonas_sp.AAC.1
MPRTHTRLPLLPLLLGQLVLATMLAKARAARELRTRADGARAADGAAPCMKRVRPREVTIRRIFQRR